MLTCGALIKAAVIAVSILLPATGVFKLISNGLSHIPKSKVTIQMNPMFRIPDLFVVDILTDKALT